MEQLNVRTTLGATLAGAIFAIAGAANATVINTGTMSCSTGTGGSAATLSLSVALDAECFSGNDTKDIDATTSIFDLTGWILADKNDDGTSGDQSITFTSGVINGDKSGSWALSSLGSAASVMVNLKAGNGWGSFLVDTTSGTWTSSKGLSHASVYYREGPDTNPVPLPAAGWMLLAGIGGLVASRRRKKA